MATDLSRVSGRRGTERRQRTRNRDTLLPSRRLTRAPDPEVNARIQRADMSGADQLRQILGMVQETGNSAMAFANEKKLQKDAKIGAEAAADFAMGQQDTSRMDVRAYRSVYHREQAKASAFEFQRTYAKRAQELVNSDDIPDLQDFEDLAEEVAQEMFLDEEGQLLPTFSETPEAAKLLASSMQQAKGSVLAEAQAAIKQRTDEDLLRTAGTNAYLEFRAEAQSWREGVTRNGARPLKPGEVRRVDLPPSEVADDEDGDIPVQRRTMGPGFRPVRGRPTSKYRSRGGAHNGVDLDGKIGDPITNPARGKVVKVSEGGPSGKHVIIDHGNGITSSYSHLSAFDVEEGEVINAGEILGRVGNTGRVRSKNGDGSHLHWVVKVNNKTVDPLSFEFPDTSGEQYADTPRTGSARRPFPEVEFGEPQETASGSMPTFDFEDLMARIPPGVDRKLAKETMLATVMQAAEEAGDYRTLDQLQSSTREDGTPSFNISEIAQLRDTRERIRERNRTLAERQKNERYEQGSINVSDAIIQSGELPSDGQIQTWREADEISADFALGLHRARDAQERQEAAELRQEARDAEYRARTELDAHIASEAEMLRSGMVGAISRQSIETRFRNGSLGEGRQGITNYNRLMAARREGENRLRQDPMSVDHATRIRNEFAPQEGGGRFSRFIGPQVSIDPTPGMLAEFWRLRGEGKAPHEAEAGAVEWGRKRYPDYFKQKDLAAARREMSALRQKQAQAQ